MNKLKTDYFQLLANLALLILFFLIGYQVKMTFTEVISIELSMALVMTVLTVICMVALIFMFRKNNQDLSEGAKITDLIYNMSNGVIMFDSQGKIITINPVAKRLIGDQSEFFFERLSCLFKDCGSDEDKMEDSPKSQLTDLFHWVKEAILQDKVTHIDQMQLGGKILEVFVTPVHDHLNKVVSGVIILYDITHLAAIEQAKAEFLSIAAHQLRSPLGSMRWNMEMLLSGDEGEISDKVKKSLMSIYLGIQRMINEVNDLLIVSRIDQKRIPDKPVSVDVVSLIHDVSQEMDYIFKQNSIKINLNYEKEFNPQIIIDSQRFRDIMQNLIHNAVKYNHSGGKVDISISEEDKQIKIDIEDTGIGIPLKEQSQIFSKFFRANNAVQTKTEGSGLGLFVVRSYVEGWGGKVWFESTEGKGTAFHLLLPYKTLTHTLDQNLSENPLQSPACKI